MELTTNGKCISSAYKPQLFAANCAIFTKVMWKAWMPPMINSSHGWPFKIAMNGVLS
jgi:hypothetical protein